MPRDSALESFTRRRALEPVEVTKKVIVLASGETERHALPFLLSHLQSRGVSVEDVRNLKNLLPNELYTARVSAKIAS